jgi:hypothetical protein
MRKVLQRSMRNMLQQRARNGVRSGSLALKAVALSLAVTTAPHALSAQGGVPQPDGFQFYWPGSCVQAVNRSDAFYWRARQDSLRYDPATDTMLTVSADLARECLAKFKSATSLEPRDYVPLAQVYLAVNDDKAAIETISRRLALPDVQASGPKAWVLADVVSALLNASPARVEATKPYFTLLDALTGAEAAVGKVRAYRSLAVYYWRTGDVPKMIAAAKRLIEVGKGLNAHDRNEFVSYLFLGYRYLAEAEAARTGDSSAARVFMTQAREDIGKLGSIEQSIRNFTSLLGLYGAKAERITADSWISTESDPVLPASGKFTLIVFRPTRASIPALRRLGTKYQSILNVVGIVGTVGYFKDLGPLTPELEAQELRKYYQDDLQFPGTIAINNTVFERIPDGRRVAQPTPNERAYRARSGAVVILVNPEGVIKRVWGVWDKSYEIRIEEALQQLSGK